VPKLLLEERQFTREFPIEPVVDEPNIFVVVEAFTREFPIEPVVDEPNIFVVVEVFTREFPIEPVVVVPNIFVVVVVLHEACADTIPIDKEDVANTTIVPILNNPCNFMTTGYTSLQLSGHLDEPSFHL
jgi:hypothetical protein